MLLILLLLLIATLWVLHIHKKYQQHEPLNYFPENASILVKINNLNAFHALCDSANLWKAIQKVKAIQQFQEQIHLVDTLLVSENIPQDNWKQKPFWIALYPNSTPQLEFLCSFRVENYLIGRNLTKLVKDTFNGRQTKVGETKIWECQTAHNTHFYFYAAPGAALLSSSADLLQKALALQADSALLSNENFQSIYRTQSATTPLSALIHVNRVMPYFTEYNQLLPLLQNQAGWVGLDVEKTTQGFTVNGFAWSLPNSLTQNSIQTLQAGPLSLESMIPAQTIKLLAYGAGAKGSDNPEFSKMLAAKGEWDNYQLQKQELTHRYQTDCEETLSQLFSGETALVTLATSNELLLAKSASGSMAAMQLQQLLKAMNRLTDPATVFSPTEHLRLPIYPAFHEGDTLFFLNRYFPSLPLRYFTAFQNTLLFARDPETIQQAVTQIIQNQTLQTDRAYQEFCRYFSSQQQCWIYLDGVWLKDWFQKNSETVDGAPWIEIAAQLPAIGLQFSTVSNLLYTTAAMVHEPNRKQPTPAVWQCKLDTTAQTQPYVIYNASTQKQEWVVQDIQNQLYWLDENGWIQWKKQLESPIIEPIQSVDFFRNRKFQLWVTTPKSLHLIDRTGQEAQPFPIQLNQPATAAATLLDYDQNGEYRIFIPDKTPMVQLYHKNGKTVDGWKMTATENTITQSLQHFTFHGKDFLVCHDTNRPYLLDRRGKERIVPKWNKKQSSQANYLADQKNNRILTLTEEGELVSVSLENGKVSVLWKPHKLLKNPFLLMIKSSGHLLIADATQIVELDHNLQTVHTLPLTLTRLSRIELLATDEPVLLLHDGTQHISHIVTLRGETIGTWSSVVPAKVKLDGHSLQLVTAGSNGNLTAYRIASELFIQPKRPVVK